MRDWDWKADLKKIVATALLLVLVAGLGIAIPTALGLNSEVSDLESTIKAKQEGQYPCSVNANKPAAKGKKLRKAINLTAEPAVGAINFDTDRSTKSLYFVLKASRPLPASITPERLEISVPRPPLRVSDTLESVSLDLPMFSPPRIINGRKEIQFRMCIDGAGLKPGTYTSQVFVSGPPGLHGTSVTAAISAKNGVFWIGGILVLLAAAVLLGVMVAQDMRNSNPLLKVVTVIGSLVAAGAAMYAVYVADPAWGADPLTSIFALGGTAFGAAGLGSFITTIFKHGAGNASADDTDP